MPGASQPQVVSDPQLPVYVRIDRVPALGPAGLTVSAAIRPSRPGERGRGAQVALACAEHAAGWSIGLDSAGRASLAVGTRHGPVSVTSATAVAADRWYEIIARIPGGPGRLEMSVQPRDPDLDESAETAGVLISAAVVASRGPLLWGCRSLFDGARPELPFDGFVADLALTAGDGLSATDAVAMSWMREEVVGFRP